MHIVQIAHEPIPVSLYGGTERIIENLCLGFVELGHKVTLISFKGDYTLEGVEFKDLGQFSKSDANTKFVSLIPDDADIIHFHLPMDQDKMDLEGIPYICTLHGNLQENETLDKLPKNTVCISNNHASRHQRETFVYNGLDQNKIPLCQQSYENSKYFSFLGKASLKRKGLHLAKKIAKTFKTPLHVGGGKGLNLFGTKFLGYLNNEEKAKLLGESKALLFPILWEEPFGLVMIEAMFAGTPVFALKRGSVSEVLGQPGSDNLFIVEESLEQLIESIKQFTPSTPNRYRQYAIQYFSKNVMCENYLEVYKKVCAGKEIK
jgi:glycosyltransferase involved in cell wall biosynthesis